MNTKILVAEVKDFEGVKVYYSLKKPVDWRNLEDEIESQSDMKSKMVSVKFIYRTQKWFDALPEYEG